MDHSSEEDLIDDAEGARLLEVVPDRIQVMVDEGLLTPIRRGTDQLFDRAEVLALRNLGG